MDSFAKPRLIRTTNALITLVNQLHDVPLLAVDTESNSLFAYKEQVCLIQLSARHNGRTVTAIQDYIVDPLAVDDLSSLGELFVDPDIEIIFHAAEYDIMCLKRDFGFEFANIFDTYIAAQTLGWPRVGLNALLNEHFNVRLDKRFQQADWSKRPLSGEQCHYAQMDTHFLPALRDILLRTLSRNGCFEEAREAFDELVHLPAAEKAFDPEGFWYVKGANILGGQRIAILRELYLWRERTAARRNLPPFKILPDSTLVALADATPGNPSAMLNVKGMTKRFADRYGRALLEAIERGSRGKPPKRNLQPMNDPEVVTRYEALHAWRKRKALARGVESNVILSKNALWALAFRAPSTYAELESVRELGPYRRAKYADEILSVLALDRSDG
jgi:ribonuclease D